MNLIDVQVKNITKVKTGLPYNSVEITADFFDEGGQYIQETRVIHQYQYELILETGEYST